jgi:N-acetyl sugar amidotransferase
MKDKKYQICTSCVMDITDPKIIFDEKDVCNHCRHFHEVTSKHWFPNDEGKKKLDTFFSKIKQKGKGKEYDCIIGLSGGVDSSYLALILKDYGLRPLVVHVDAGWNSELAVYNIEQIVKHCGYDLHTHVMDWQEIKDLQLAYLKSGVANQDTVQDHAFFASLYHFAAQHNIRYVISGGNISTESVFPKAWHHSAMDAMNLKSIHGLFGKRKLSQYKTISFFEYFFYYPFIKGMEVVRPLNFMPYNKSEALKFLKEKINYKEYERKHGESRFTKFFQNYYLPKKFNIDKRRPHLSSQILSYSITRDEALRELQKPLYDEIELSQDKAYIAKKLEISVDELDRFTYKKGTHYSEYTNWDTRYKLMIKVKKLVQKVIGRNVKTYS